MEENIDPIKESGSNEEETLKKDSVIENAEENKSMVNNLNSLKKDVKLDEQKKTIEISNINNNNLNVPVNNLLNKTNVADVIDNTVIKDTNKIKAQNESESSDLTKIKPKKEIPIEKKPFNEFVNDHLLPTLVNEFKERGFEVDEINLKNTSRPIAGDKCWVIFCEIKNICNFWLSFEKNDISSLKSISLCKSNQTPSVIESFLIDEKRITLKLIISRILQRLNGQKLIGDN
tara:strand:+ start:2468 stop:3163 length:696 start_codon:yes stop_codon:yes gene_type:complete